MEEKICRYFATLKITFHVLYLQIIVELNQGHEIWIFLQEECQTSSFI